MSGLKTYMIKGSVVALDGSMSVIFSSEKLINALKTTTEIFVDGTFSVRCFFLERIFLFWFLNALILYALYFLMLFSI